MDKKRIVKYPCTYCGGRELEYGGDIKGNDFHGWRYYCVFPHTIVDITICPWCLKEGFDGLFEKAEPQSRE